jgi:hypothetical protein
LEVETGQALDMAERATTALQQERDELRAALLKERKEAQGLMDQLLQEREELKVTLVRVKIELENEVGMLQKDKDQIIELFVKEKEELQDAIRKQKEELTKEKDELKVALDAQIAACCDGSKRIEDLEHQLQDMQDAARAASQVILQIALESLYM